MAKCGYTISIPASAPVALAPNTAKTVLAVIAPASFGIDLQGFEIGLDGTVASAVPITVELCSSTQATAGTSTAGTVVQDYGNRITAGFTGAYNYTVEPTVLTAVRAWTLTPVGSTLIQAFPWGQTPDVGPGASFAIRMKAPAAVNVTGTMRFERT